MITITIGNSYSTIKGLSVAQEKELQKELSYVVGGSGAYYTGFGPKRRSLFTKKGSFPTGLLERVKAHLIKHKLPVIVDKTKLNVPYNKHWPYGMYEDAYEWQRKALNAAYSNHRGAIRAPTGTGKSRAMGMIAEAFGCSTLWVVPSLEIKKQTIEAWGHLKNVTITNIDDKKLEKLTDFDMLLIDECHGVAAKQYHKLNKTAWTGIFYRYSFSATPFRNDDEETILYESIAGQEIYSLSYADAVKNKYIVPLESYYIESPKQITDAYTYAQVYSELIVKNTAKNTMLAKLLTSLHSSGKSTLCLVKEIAHGEALQELTGLPFVNGQDTDSRKYIKRFNEGALKVLIGTTGVLSEGVDTRACEYVVIAGSGKAKSQFMQACGRGMRNFPGKESAKVILVKDKSHRFLTRHFSAQVKILLAEYGAIPVKLEV